MLNFTMAKLQKQISRKVGDKEYAKYVVVIPKEDVENAGFKEGEEIKIKAIYGKLVLTKN